MKQYGSAVMGAELCRLFPEVALPTQQINRMAVPHGVGANLATPVEHSNLLLTTAGTGAALCA